MKEIKVDFGGGKRIFGRGKLDRPLLRKYHNSVADRVARSREREKELNACSLSNVNLIRKIGHQKAKQSRVKRFSQ